MSNLILANSMVEGRNAAPVSNSLKEFDTNFYLFHLDFNGALCPGLKNIYIGLFKVENV